MISYKLLQHFDQHGQNSGYSIEVLVDASDIDPLDIDDDSSFDAYGEHFEFLEQLRTEILCINSGASETHMRLLQGIENARVEFNHVCSSLEKVSFKSEV